MNTVLMQRCQALQEKLIENNISFFIISSPFNVSYLTGVYPISHYEREAFILATPKKIYLFFSQFRSEDFKNLDFFSQHVLNSTNRLSHYLTQYIKSPQLWFESENLSWKEYDYFQTTLGIDLVPISNFIEELRLIKDDLEIKHLTKASHIVAKSWAQAQKYIKPGITEKFLAWKLMDELHQLGSQGIPYGFEPIVAFGTHSASPHHTPTDTKLKKNDILLVDFGACINGYASDFTRTLLLGDLPAIYHETYALVQKAYDFGLKQMQIPKTLVSEVDSKVFRVFDQANKGNLFIHTSGHGIGLSVHEPPSIYRTPVKDSQLKKGMVVTLEPGLYLQNQFGIRHENTLLITGKGAKELTVVN